ncbi:MAG TPA: S8 family serine peptidase [Anaerolineales bacterium]|nr:S8 family serine peptidase [Anaerolineales bacterium]
MKSRMFKLVTLLMLASLLFAVIGSQPVKADRAATQLKQTLAVSENGIYVVRLQDASLAAYRGGIAGLRATSPEATGARQLDPSSADSQAYLDYLRSKQGELLSGMTRAFGHPIEVKYQYLHVLNAMAVRISHEEAQQAYNLPGVIAVYPSELRHLNTDVGPTLIGAPTIWEGDTPEEVGTRGEGIIIGVLDSGINHAHPSFADVGPVDGYDHTNPWGDGVYVGVCVADPSFCNDKLLGGYDYADTAGPEDVDGHGSHTASTTGGNYVEVEFDDGIGGTFTLTISGVAPHANLVAYKVLDDQGSGWTDDITAGINQSVADMVNVLNYSIGGDSVSDPWVDMEQLAFLDASTAGIFISVSAGNAGPTAGTIGHTAPWTAVVGGITHKRILSNLVDIATTEESIVGLNAFQGNGPMLTDGYDNIPIVFAGDIDAANLLGCDRWDTDAFEGKIGMVQRGDCVFADKVNNLAEVGAVAVLVYNNVAGPPVAMAGLEATTIPAVMIDKEDGAEVVNLISGDASATGTMHEARFLFYNDDWNDVMYGSSSRGPGPWELLTPNYNAPAVNILAAVAAVGEEIERFDLYNGTSMASPHGAGSGALLMALHPNWSPAEIRSAIATTAIQDVLESDGVTSADPFDSGSGRINLTGAAFAGFVLDETSENFIAANPYIGGEPNTLNQPSMMEVTCFGTCSWTRTITSTKDTDEDWTISYEATGMTLSASPETFTLPAGGTQTIEITATLDIAAVPDVYYFGNVILTPTNIDIATAHLPVIVQMGISNIPAYLDIRTDALAGTVTLTDLQAYYDITDLWVEVSGLTKGVSHDLVMNQDPTNTEVYDDLSQVYWTTIAVPNGAARLVAEVVASEAPDVDLFVGTGDIPSEDTEVCSSASGVWVEYCNLDYPERGTYWVLVQNWWGSDDQPDAIHAITALVLEDEVGNLTVTGPESVPSMDIYALDVNWDEPGMLPGDFWYAQFTAGTERLTAGNLGYVNVDLEYFIEPIVTVLPLIFKN